MFKILHLSAFGKCLASVNVDTTAHMTVFLTILFLLLKYMTVGVHI